MNAKDVLKDVVEEVSEEELAVIAGGKKGKGWLASITDDCPNSIIVCC